MINVPGTIKHTDTIPREEFIRLFSSDESLEEWFTGKERDRFSFPANARSLGARYLIKKRICDQLENRIRPLQIEIANDELGKPELIFGEEVRQVFDSLRIRKILCSISHSRNYIAGMTVFCYGFPEE